MSIAGWQVMNSLTKDSSVRAQELAPGTAARVLGYARPYRRLIAAFLGLVVLDAVLVVAIPLLIKSLIDDGIYPRNSGVVVRLSLLVAAIALVSAAVSLVSRWLSARIGEGLTRDLRTQVFDHVLSQPIAFFTRTQTGALVSRLGSDVVGAQQAFTSVLSSVVSNTVSLALIIGTMVVLSWQLTLGALVLVPLFLIPARAMGARLAGLAHEQMSLNAQISTRMTERFNVAGALLVKIYGDPGRESREYAERAEGVRDMGVRIALNRSVFFVGLTLIASLATALVYGFGGLMAVGGTLTVGTLLALTALLARLYGPLTTISNARVDVMTALVSFQRVFEVLDLTPLVAEAPDARPLPTGPVGVDIDHVSFAYPSAEEVSLDSLELTAVDGEAAGEVVLNDIDITIAPGQLVALVGPSGSGKSTLASLIARLYDPTHGAIRVGGMDLRSATSASLRDTVSVVTQDAHLFHASIRDNLLYAAPNATDADLRQALDAAYVSDLVERLPAGLDTIVGDRGHRLSGGEKQRLALARLFLKGPRLVVLDEATAHLDSESEVAVQRALDAALVDRTSVVIAHRLSTVRHADLILVMDRGRIVERGTHSALVEAGGLYADLYATQFADPDPMPTPAPI